ncbi:MAG: hypothetical protein MUF11_01965 [Beijerinckiaceae bacterium]|nr:hypothetical protein [Beijerinckiaceae bacterium]
MARKGLALAFALVSAPAIAQTPPPAGWALSLGFGAGWHSNPNEISTRSKGDGFLSPEIGLAYRQPLWEGGALTLSVSAGSEFYARERNAGVQRASATASISHIWQGTFFAFTLGQRKALSHDFARHDSASTEFGLNISRTIALDDRWSLLVFTRAARRLLNDGTYDQWRGSINGTLTYKSVAWSWRMGGGFSYALEDKTPFLPRINDRTVSARLGVGYEWAKDREIAIGGSFSRTFSSYQPNRYKSFTIQPRVSATIRF